MKRNIITIDAEKCNGCGICIDACHEGALQLVDGKAVLVSDSYCDGLGNCLPECPTGAITMIEREALPYDEEVVLKRMAEKKEAAAPPERLACGCPGTQSRTISHHQAPAERVAPAHTSAPAAAPQSQLRQWPCQIKLVPVNAPYLEGASLLIAADCTAFAYGNLHQEFMQNKVTLIGCPKLDAVDYADKLTEILKAHEIKNITVLRMEVPCCGGLVQAVKQALIASGKMIPWQVVTISVDGQVLD